MYSMVLALTLAAPGPASGNYPISPGFIPAAYPGPAAPVYAGCAGVIVYPPRPVFHGCCGGVIYPAGCCGGFIPYGGCYGGCYGGRVIVLPPHCIVPGKMGKKDEKKEGKKEGKEEKKEEKKKENDAGRLGGAPVQIQPLVPMVVYSPYGPVVVYGRPIRRVVGVSPGAGSP